MERLQKQRRMERKGEKNHESEHPDNRVSAPLRRGLEQLDADAKGERGFRFLKMGRRDKKKAVMHPT